MHISIRSQACLLVLAAMAAAGCGADELTSPTGIKLRGIAAMYLDYAVSAGRGPANEAALKKHMRAVPDFILRMNGLDDKNIDAAFMSERDQEPFVIRYGLGGISVGGPSTPVVAHEKTGKNGKRLVAFAHGVLELVDEERFAELAKESKL